MKTKIKAISPDQNIITHESGLKTVFVPRKDCDGCIYLLSSVWCSDKPCSKNERYDSNHGNFTKLIEQ